MAKVKRLEPFVEVLNEYIPHVEENPHWHNSRVGGSLLLRAIIYMVTKHQVLPGDRELAKKVVDVLLESGVDPSFETPFGENKSRVSPLELCEMADSKLYDYLVNKTLEAPASFESAAFENKFTDFLKGTENVLGKAIQLGGKVVSTPLTLLNKFANSKLGKAIERRGQENKHLQAAANNARTQADQIVKERGQTIDDSKKKKQLEAFNLLPDELKNNDKQLAMALASQMAKEGGASSPLLKASQALTNTLQVEVATQGKKSNLPFWFLLDGKFGKGLTETIAKHRAGGLGPDQESALKQMKVIAYWLDKEMDVSQLRTSGRWRPVGGMEKIVKNLQDSKGNIRDPNSSTGKEILCSILKKKNISSQDFINHLSGLMFNDDTSKAGEFFKEYKVELTSLLEKTFKKTMEDDNLVDIFNNSLIKITKKKNPEAGLTEEQEQALQALKGLGIEGAMVLKEIKKLSGTTQEIVFKILQKWNTRG